MGTDMVGEVLAKNEKNRTILGEFVVVEGMEGTVMPAYYGDDTDELNVWFEGLETDTVKMSINDLTKAAPMRLDESIKPDHITKNKPKEEHKPLILCKESSAAEIKIQQQRREPEEKDKLLTAADEEKARQAYAAIFTKYTHDINELNMRAEMQD